MLMVTVFPRAPAPGIERARRGFLARLQDRLSGASLTSRRSQDQPSLTGTPRLLRGVVALVGGRMVSHHGMLVFCNTRSTCTASWMWTFWWTPRTSTALGRLLEMRMAPTATLTSGVWPKTMSIRQVMGQRVAMVGLELWHGQRRRWWHEAHTPHSWPLARHTPSHCRRRANCTSNHHCVLRWLCGSVCGSGVCVSFLSVSLSDLFTPPGPCVSVCLCVAVFGRSFVWGWGSNGQLGLGRGVLEVTRTPTVLRSANEPKGQAKVSLGSLGRWRPAVPVRSIAAGADHTLCILDTGRVIAWGANRRGQLGLGHRRDVFSPQLVASIKRRVSQVAAGARHSAMLTAAGSVYVAGAGECSGHGGLFDATNAMNAKTAHLVDARLHDSTPFGTATDKLVPAGVQALSRFSLKHVSCGFAHTAVVTATGDMFTWGAGADGQLGLGVFLARTMPGLVQVRPLCWRGVHVLLPLTSRLGVNMCGCVSVCICLCLSVCGCVAVWLCDVWLSMLPAPPRATA